MRSTAIASEVPSNAQSPLPAAPDDLTSSARSRAEAPAASLVVHAVAHTHWDREWYHAASRFQARLVALVDALLAGPVVGQGTRVSPDAPFLLDGQAIVLADYLAIRPERTADVAQALIVGAIEAGPWYVLADNLIPSGEAIIRNLEAGRRWLARLGGVAPRVAYCPDTFGHPAALPTIAAEFGCEVAIVWRGAGGATFPASDTAWWYGPDGRRVLLYHLPPDGYEFGSALPDQPDLARGRWARIAQVLRARNHTGVALLTVGADHHAASPGLPQAIALLDAAAHDDGAQVRRASLSQAAQALWDTASESRATPLPVVVGELRDGYGYTWTLQGTFATRAHQKRRNARLERALLRDVEPWTALAWFATGADAQAGTSANKPADHPADRQADVQSPPPRAANDGTITLAQLPVLVSTAWDALLRTHPHDTLCGCSADVVAAAMTTAQDGVAAVLPELRTAALASALRHDRVAARSAPVAQAPLTVVRNRVARPRGGLVELRLLETLGDVRVGPDSGKAPLPDAAAPPRRPLVGGCVVQPLARRVRHDRRESPQHYPDDDLVRVHSVLAWLPSTAAVPALGVRVIADAEPERSADDVAGLVPVTVTRDRDRDRLVLENGRVRVEASRAGLTLVVGDRRLSDVLAIETVRDRGDSYTPSLRGAPESLRLTAVRLGARGPLRGSMRLRWDWRAGRARIRVWTEIILDADAPHVRCDVRGWNARRDHRLQLVWRTDVGASAQVTADAAFGSVLRTPIVAPRDAQPSEQPPHTMPLHRWLTVHAGARGATMLSDGLAEGEAAHGRLAVTLVRGLDQLSRADLPERPGHAGWACAIPDAQCLGAFRARVGLLVHDAWSETTRRQIEAAADAVLLPLVGESWRDLREAPRALHGPMLEGDDLHCSTVRVSDDGRTVLLRAVNGSEQTARGRWVLPSGVGWSVRPCRADGTALGAWSLPLAVVEITAGPRALVTYQVRRAD